MLHGNNEIDITCVGMAPVHIALRKEYIAAGKGQHY